MTNLLHIRLAKERIINILWGRKKLERFTNKVNKTKEGNKK